MSDAVSLSYSSLLESLAANISQDDVKEFLAASKDELIRGRKSDGSGGKEWLQLLEENQKLSHDNLLYVEHLFEICRRPDLLTILLEYRADSLSLSDSHTHTSSKYRDIIREPSLDESIKLAPPPKKV
uniref:Astrocytic phosphoprotein PEA-15 n=1 Tax=Callorhinchus milii TaxID=7868 RepID=V9L4P9_CALMI|eukprot:gi/632991773/ref/XP_007884779.1/ PREDICTED: astrocytic phosphoprotein PEA-15 [Callorhinchus milii]